MDEPIRRCVDCGEPLPRAAFWDLEGRPCCRACIKLGWTRRARRAERARRQRETGRIVRRALRRVAAARGRELVA